MPPGQSQAIAHPPRVSRKRLKQIVSRSAEPHTTGDSVITRPHRSRVHLPCSAKRSAVTFLSDLPWGDLDPERSTALFLLNSESHWPGLYHCNKTSSEQNAGPIAASMLCDPGSPGLLIR